MKLTAVLFFHVRDLEDIGQMFGPQDLFMLIEMNNLRTENIFLLFFRKRTSFALSLSMCIPEASISCKNSTSAASMSPFQVDPGYKA